MFRSLQQWTVAFCVLMFVTVEVSASRDDGIVVLPRMLDLGSWPGEQSVPARIWIVNTTSEPLRITQVKASCGCMTVHEVAFELSPQECHAIDFDIRVKHDAGASHKTIRVMFDGYTDQVIPVTVRSTGVPKSTDPAQIAALPTPNGIQVVPPILDLGFVCPGDTASGRIWLMNNGNRPAQLKEAKPDCGCITLLSYQPTTLRPAGAIDINLSMQAPTKLNQPKTRTLTITREDGLPIKIPVTICTASLLEVRLRAYLKARKEDLDQLAQTFLAKDYRVWFEQREGPGQKPGPDGNGPWASWDHEFNASSKADSFAVNGRSVEVTMTETNDFYALLQWPAGRLRITYYFDSDDRISGRLVEGIGKGDRPDTLERFAAWASDHAPEELAVIYPDEEIVPSRENAKRWRKLLERWRRERANKRES